MAGNSASEEGTSIPSAPVAATATATAVPTLNATSTSTSTSNTVATTTTTASVQSTARPVVRPQFLQQRHNPAPTQPQYMPSSSPRPQNQSHVQFGGKPSSHHIPVPDQLPPFRYPLASTGRGFIASNCNSRSFAQMPDQTLAVTNPNPNSGTNPAPCSASSRPAVGYHPPAPPHPAPSSRPFGFAPNSSPPVVKGFPVSAHSLPLKVGSSSCSLPDSNGVHKASGEMGKGDVYVSVRDRKVKISDGASMYALCRSWLRNGHPEESQPQLEGMVKSLPKPAPLSLSEVCSPKRKEAEEEEEKEISEKDAEAMSTKELLQLHIKRAKRVRERLREERLQRIARYKTRLALLLPPLAEQCRNEPSEGG